jgi:hypothetical protein
MAGASALEAGLVAVPVRLLDLGAGGPEVLGLVAEVGERDVELGLVELGLERVLGRERADEAVGRRARSRRGRPSRKDRRTRQRA